MTDTEKSPAAGIGLEILIVDADLRNASLHRLLGLGVGIGFSHCSTGGFTPRARSFCRAPQPATNPLEALGA